jgi:hypothetical protein
MRRAILIALDSVGVDPLGHDRPGSVYAESAFLFPRGRSGTPLELPRAPIEGALVETDVTGGRTSGSIECAITYTTLMSGQDALAAHGLVQGLGSRDRLLEGLIEQANLFARFDRPALANAIFPAHLPCFRGGYVEDLAPTFERAAIEASVRYRGAPVVLGGKGKHGFAELYTLYEVNHNVFVHAARRASVRLRTWDDVRAGEALTGSLTHELEAELDLRLFCPPGARGHEDGRPLAPRSADEAAQVIARLSAAHDLVFYKVQLADLVSHTGRLDLARDCFLLLERFIGAVLARVDAQDTLVVVTSDHGHLEQTTFAHGHPRSMVPTWVFAPGARDLAGACTTPVGIHRLVAGVTSASGSA